MFYGKRTYIYYAATGRRGHVYHSRGKKLQRTGEEEVRGVKRGQALRKLFKSALRYNFLLSKNQKLKK